MAEQAVTLPYEQQSMFDEEEPESYEVVRLDTPANRLKVAKSNALVEAHYDLTPLENKLMLLAMSKVRRDQTGAARMVFRMSELCHHLGVSERNASRDLKRLSKSLMRKQVEIRKPDSQDWDLHQWVSRAWVSGGDFGIKFDEELMPHLVGLVSRFTMFQLERVLQMTSSYSIRLYELLKQYENMGSRTFSLAPELTKGEPWSDFSAVMAYNPKTYQRYSNIRQRILTPAIEQIERLTELKNLTITQRKFQRKTIAITISFESRPVIEHLKDGHLYRRLKSVGLADRYIKYLVSEFDSLRIEKNLDHVQAAYPSKRNSELGLLVKAAVEKDYAEASKSLGPRPSTNPTKPSVRQLRVQDHPLYEDCANDLEAERLIAAERKLGRAFGSYAAFAQYQLDQLARRQGSGSK